MHLENFLTLDLENAQKVSFMNRSDCKYVCNTNLLPLIIKELENEYFIQVINQNRSYNYTSNYFDTKDFQMYLNHHNKRLNRYKIREREYCDTGETFFEIKRKTNKGETIKKRFNKSNKTITNYDFVKKHSIYTFEELEQKLSNSFNRITLINKNFTERITIDSNIKFWTNDKSIELPWLVVIERKSEKNMAQSTFSKVMIENRIFPFSISKYCIGISLLYNSIKNNNFKIKLLKLNKINN